MQNLGLFGSIPPFSCPQRVRLHGFPRGMLGSPGVRGGNTPGKTSCNVQLPELTGLTCPVPQGAAQPGLAGTLRDLAGSGRRRQSLHVLRPQMVKR